MNFPEDFTAYEQGTQVRTPEHDLSMRSDGTARFHPVFPTVRGK